MIGKGATPSFFAIANDNYTLTGKVEEENHVEEEIRRINEENGPQ